MANGEDDVLSRPYPPLTNPPAAGEAGGLFIHTQLFTAIFNTTDVVVVVVVVDEMKKTERTY